MSDQRNLIIAIALSLAILLGFQFFVEAPQQERQNETLEKQMQEQTNQGSDGAITPAAPGAAHRRQIDGWQCCARRNV